MQFRKSGWALAAIAALAVGWAAGAEDTPENEPNFWMKKKMEASQHILAALATEDYAQIAKSATSMNKLSQIESWSRRTHVEEYRTQLRIFRYANEELVRQANKKNIDGAALAFSQLTLSCVNCHKLIRDVKE